MQCAALKLSGERCRNQAIKGTSFCRSHQGNSETPRECGEIPEETPLTVVAPEETLVPAVQTPYKKFSIRYIGNGSYSIRGISFRGYGDTHEVPRDVFERLIQQEDLFEEA